jgi:hypothetical protein
VYYFDILKNKVIVKLVFTLVFLTLADYFLLRFFTPISPYKLALFMARICTASGPDVIHLGFPGGSHPLNFIFETEKALTGT